MSLFANAASLTVAATACCMPWLETMKTETFLRQEVHSGLDIDICELDAVLRLMDAATNVAPVCRLLFRR